MVVKIMVPFGVLNTAPDIQGTPQKGAIFLTTTHLKVNRWEYIGSNYKGKPLGVYWEYIVSQNG